MGRYWWDQYGKFPPENGAETFPDPIMVLRAYQKKQEITARQIAESLGIGERSAYYAFSDGRNLDSLTFRRKMCQLMKIPPQLLRLDAEHRTPDWWKPEYPFTSGSDGYPQIGEVIRFFRRKKGWSQGDLALAFDPPITQNYVSKMETEAKGLDSMDRRYALKVLLEIAGTSAALLGLHDIPTTPGVQALLSGNKPLSTLLPEYEKNQGKMFDLYYAGHGSEVLRVVRKLIPSLQDLLPLARSDAERNQLLTLIANYHSFIIFTGREEMAYHLVHDHANQNVSLAQDALQGNRTPANHERLALALFYRAEALREQGQLPEAQKDIDLAASYAKNIHVNTKCRIFMEMGTIECLSGQTTQGLRHLDNADALIPAVRRDENQFHSRFSGSFVQLRRAMALPAGSRRLDEILPIALKNADTDRRRLILSVVEAGHEQARGNEKQAATLAISALQSARNMQSKLNIRRLYGVYTNLLQGPERNSPEVCRLNLMFSRL